MPTPSLVIDNLMFRCDAEATETIMKRFIAALILLSLTVAVPAFAQEKENHSDAVRATLLLSGGSYFGLRSMSRIVKGGIEMRLTEMVSCSG
jgi:hypothetical protein